MQITFLDGDDSNLTNKYTHKCSAPQYAPTDVKPHICELYNLAKRNELLVAINSADVSAEEKEFLKLAATRHIVFNYAKIADYYAHATPEMQRLMEQSALVIIDVDDAIQNGYIKLSKTVKDIIEADKYEE